MVVWSAGASGLIAADGGTADYRYAVAWDQWDDQRGGAGKLDRARVRLNGRLLAHRDEAFRRLTVLDLSRGDRVRLEMSRQPGRTWLPLHARSSFLQEWIRRGVHLDWFEGGKRYELHTVTWTDFKSFGEYVSSMDDATWIVDGTTVGRGREFARHIEPWEPRRNVVIQWVEPVDWHPRHSVDSGVSVERIEQLRRVEGIRVFDIRPGHKAGRSISAHPE